MANHKNNSNMDPLVFNIKEQVASKEEVAKWILTEMENVQPVQSGLEKGIEFYRLNQRYPKFVSRKLYAQIKGVSISSVNNYIAEALSFIEEQKQKQKQEEQ